jgi:predicted transposase YdaD
MYEQLFEESPTLQSAVQRLADKRVAEVLQEIRQKIRQEGLQEGRQEGLQEGRQEGLQEGRQGERQERLRDLRGLLVDFVQARYPNLTELARLHANRIDQPSMLDLLIRQVMVATDADAIRKLLSDARAER